MPHLSRAYAAPLLDDERRLEGELEEPEAKGPDHQAPPSGLLVSHLQGRVPDHLEAVLDLAAAWPAKMTLDTAFPFRYNGVQCGTRFAWIGVTRTEASVKFIVQFVKPFVGWKDIPGAYHDTMEKAISRALEAVKDGYKSVRIFGDNGTGFKVLRRWTKETEAS